MFVGLGIPIPILDEEMMRYVSVANKDIYTNIYDYSVKSRTRPSLGKVSYEELRSGKVVLDGKEIPTAPLSSLSKAREIANELKQWIEKGEFLLQEPIKQFPSNNSLNALNTKEDK